MLLQTEPNFEDHELFIKMYIAYDLTEKLGYLLIFENNNQENLTKGFKNSFDKLNLGGQLSDLFEYVEYFKISANSDPSK